MRKSRMDPIDSGVPNRSKRSAFQGRLWKGNPSGDLTKATPVRRQNKARLPVPGASHAEPKGEVHTVPASWGPSTGPRTPEGLERSRRARWKGGRYSEKRKEWRRQFRAFIRRYRAELRAIRCELKALVETTQFGPRLVKRVPPPDGSQFQRRP